MNHHEPASRRHRTAATGRPPDPRVSVAHSSPRDWKSGGRSLTLHAGYAETRFGRALFAESPRGLCHLSFLDPWGETQAWNDLLARWTGARVIRDDHVAKRLAKAIYPRRDSARKPLRVHLSGTEFQLAVWDALLQIPEGQVTTYGEVAEAIGNPKAHRATGTAVGKNPVAWVVPCHRVIRRDGVLGNYRWGPERKLAMLEWEKARRGQVLRS